MSFLKPKGKLYTLLKDGDPNFMTLLHRKNFRYNIGFASKQAARHLQYTMNPIRPNIRLRVEKQTPKVDIGDIINDKLAMDFGHIYFCPNHILSIDKQTTGQRTYQKELVQHLLYHTHVSEIPSSEFVMLPLIKESGVVIPYEVIEEDLNQIHYKSHLIFPESYLDLTNDRDYLKTMENLYKNC